MRHFSLGRKLKTWFRILGEGGASAAWSLLTKRIGERSRIMPGGLLRVGTCFFRCPDAESREELVMGVYEASERFAAKHFIRRDIAVVELGGSLGVVSCHVNRRLRNPSNHVVVEANPEIVPVLTENRDRNRCRFDIVHGAVGAEGSTVRMYIASSTMCSSLIASTDRYVDVPTVTLGSIAAERGFGRFALVCDIEGAESCLIRSELATFQSHVEVFVVEFHPWINGPDDVGNSRRLLREHGFEQLWQDKDTFVFKNSALS